MSDGGKEDKFPAYRAAGVVFFTAVKGKVADRSPKRKPTSETFSHSHAFPRSTNLILVGVITSHFRLPQNASWLCTVTDFAVDGLCAHPSHLLSDGDFTRCSER